ncbi:MAG: GGDEF domain-containing protein [Cocleimonas sp.]|nr:GGDEF domain-containing protein [Cocleimonas sp.]
MATDFEKAPSDSLVEVRQEQVMHLYANTGLSFWGNIIIAIVLAAMLSMQTEKEQTLHLFIWFGLIIAASIYRLVITNSFQKERTLSQEKINYWVNKYVNISTIINVIWGSIGIFFFPESLLYQGILFLSLLSILLASVPLLALSRAIYYLQMVVVLLPITLYILWQGGKDHYLMMVALFVTSMTLLAATNYIHELLSELQTTQAKLLEQANTDQLTKIPNRRQYDQAFKTEWRRCTREDLPISMLLIDVDYFKKYNDRFGHSEGDECLVNVAGRLAAISRRPGDIAARYGGEEFAVLLPNTSLENAMMLAERFRVSIERLAIKHPDSDYEVLTVSIGVSSCDPMQRDSSDVVYPAMLMNSADNAMYLAKRQGRNRIATQGCGEQKIANILHEEALKDANRAQQEERPETVETTIS